VVLFPTAEEIYFRVVQTGYEAHPGSQPVGAEGSFPNKAQRQLRFLPLCEHTAHRDLSVRRQSQFKHVNETSERNGVFSKGETKFNLKVLDSINL
jgi:hypothetical protein